MLIVESRRALLRNSALVGALCLLVTGTAFAQQPTYTFDIPSESLAQALHDFARVSGQQIIFTPEQVAGKSVPALRGQYTADQALSRLFAGTNLVVDHSSSAGLMVQSKNARAAHNEGAATEHNARTGSNDETQQDAGYYSTERIIVTGSRIPQTAKDGAQEVRKYTVEQIEQSGQSTVADFLNTLPDVSMNSTEAAVGGNYADQTTVQLHGLPEGTTLVLINGRRVEINNYGFFDLNNIPVSAIDRIEVLPVGSSAIYGADSLAGAVNLVLKNDIDGFTANGKYGFASGTAEQDADLGWGKVWDRGAIYISGSYQDRDGLLGSQRSVTTSLNSYDNSTRHYNDICDPGTVYSLNGGNLPGLSSSVAAIPTGGISGTPTIQSFEATAGQSNKCSYLDNFSLIPPTQRFGSFIQGHYQISDSIDVFTEVLFSREAVNSQEDHLFSESYDGFKSTLPASNAFNPFGQAVGLGYTYSGLNETFDRDTNFIRPLVGVRGSLWGDWTYETTASLSEDQSNVREQEENAAGLTAALNSSNPATALDPFSGGAPGSPQLLASLISTSTLKFNSENFSGQGLLRGTAFSLPSGPVQLAVGAEYDHSSIYTAETSASTSQAPYKAARDAYSIFAETRIPIIANHDRPELGERLAVSLAGRYDDTDDYGGKTTGQAGVEWRPNDSLLVRGGFALSYQAPQLPEIAGSPSTFTTTGLPDPFRGNQAATSITEESSAPNPNLKPEDGESRELGVVYSSESLPGLETSLTYWGINIHNYIGIPSSQTLIDNPSLYPGAVTRAAPSASDIAQGYLGPITNIDDAYYNFGTLDVAGFDFDLRYAADTDFGTLTPTISVTETYKYNSALAPGLPTANYVNQANLSGTGFTPRWKGTVGISWKEGPYSASADGRYIGNFNDYAGYSTAAPLDLGNTWYYDLYLRYEIGQALVSEDQLLKGTYIGFGGVNLLDNLPKASTYPGAYIGSESDIRGRFLYVQLGVKW